MAATEALPPVIDFEKASSSLIQALHRVEMCHSTEKRRSDFEQELHVVSGQEKDALKIAKDSELEAILDLSLRTRLETHIRDGTLERPNILESGAFYLLDLVLHLAEKSIVEPTLFANMLQDLVDGHAVSSFARFFSVFEQLAERLAPLCVTARVARMSAMRVGNEILRRVGKPVGDSSLSGRVVLFFSYIMPLGDAAGLAVPPPSVSAVAPDATPEIAADEPPATADANFYRSFWSLQSYFYNPSSLTKPEAFASFTRSAEVVLNFFSTVPTVVSPPAPLLTPPQLALDAHAYFVKFLSHGRLFKLQLRDPHFRRQVLTELLTLLQTINFTPMRPPLAPTTKQKLALPFIPPAAAFKDKQKTVSDLQRLTRDLLERTTPAGHAFADAVSKALLREVNWVLWKRDSGPAFERAATAGTPSADATTSPNRAMKRRKPTGPAATEELPVFAHNGIPLDSLALDSAAEQGHSLEEFVLRPLREEADPESGIEPAFRRSHNKMWIWKSYRLIARNDLRLFAKMQAAEKGQESNLEVLVRQTAAAPPGAEEASQTVDTKVTEEEQKVVPLEEPVDLPDQQPTLATATDPNAPVSASEALTLSLVESPPEEHEPKPSSDALPADVLPMDTK